MADKNGDQNSPTIAWKALLLKTSPLGFPVLNRGGRGVRRQPYVLARRFVERQAKTADRTQAGVTVAKEAITTRVWNQRFLRHRLQTCRLQLIGGSV